MLSRQRFYSMRALDSGTSQTPCFPCTKSYSSCELYVCRMVPWGCEAPLRRQRLERPSWVLGRIACKQQSVSGRGGREGRRKQMRANANKCRQTLTNASKRRCGNASKRLPSFMSASGGGTEGGAILLHVCGSPDPLFMQRNEPFLPYLNLHPREGNPWSTTWYSESSGVALTPSPNCVSGRIPTKAFIHWMRCFGLGNCVKGENFQKGLGEGAEGVLEPGSKRLLRVFCTFCIGATPCRDGASGFRSLGPRDLLHPLLTTIVDCPFSGTFPDPWLPSLALSQSKDASLHCSSNCPDLLQSPWNPKTEF